MAVRAEIVADDVEKLTPINLGWLEVGALIRFGISVLPGQVMFSIAAQKHTMKEHPADYDKCLSLMALAVKSPTHVGRSPDHKDDGFELIYEAATEDYIMLVALKLEQREDGTFAVSSAYPINRDKLERRVRKGFVKKIQ